MAMGWRLKGLILLACVASCTTDFHDGFSEIEWQTIRTLSPLPEPPPCPVAGDCAAAALLGQRLFFETRYSGAIAVDGAANGGLGLVGEAGKVACASCHMPSSWLYDTRSRPNETTIGTGWSKRNTPTVVNAVYLSRFTWTGRFDDLAAVVEAPVTSPVLMNSTREAVAALMRTDYAADLAAVFAPSVETDELFRQFGMALAAYQRELVSGDAPFDRWVAGETDAISDSAKRGLRLFLGEAQCIECHKGPLFTDEGFHSVGVPQVGQYVDAVDLGRGSLAGHEDEAGLFRTPPLRNVARTAPYMHAGQLGTLGDVVWHYARGGEASGYSGEKDFMIVPLDLDDQDVLDLVSFMESLNGADPAPELLVAP